jgi:hypothetical protein
MVDMKKTLLMLTVLMLAVPAMAAVSIDVNDLGNGWAAIEYTADSNVSAFGLTVTVDSNATIDDVNNYHVGESTSSTKGYGIFLGTIVIDGNGDVTSYGTPIAPNTDPGASGTGLGTSTVILELGALYEDGNQPPLSGKLCELKVSGCCKMSVAGEATRCGEVSMVAAGAVLEGGSTAVVIDDTNCTDVQIDYNCGPACWACPLWPLGDIDGNGWIAAADAVPIGNNYGSPASAYPCADLDKNGWIAAADAVPIGNNYGGGTGVPCP